MKLWYQSLARQTESTPYGEMLRRVIDKACDPGTTVHMQGVQESAGIGVHYRLVKMGELAAKLRARTGRFTSKRGGYAAPTGDFLERVRKFYGPEVYPGAE